MEKINNYLGILLLLFVSFGCDKEYDSIPVITSGPEGVRATASGLEFTYQILDKDGKPTIRLKEGEPFSFYFEMKNNRKDQLYYRGNTFSCDLYAHGLAKVITNNKEELGDGFVCPQSATLRPFNEGEVSTISKEFSSSKTEGIINSLSQGEYYTELNNTFSFGDEDGDVILVVGPLTFRIDFTVE